MYNMQRDTAQFCIMTSAFFGQRMVCGLNFKEVIYKKSSRFVAKLRLSQLDAIDTYDEEDYLSDDECVEPYIQKIPENLPFYISWRFKKKKKIQLVLEQNWNSKLTSNRYASTLLLFSG